MSVIFEREGPAYLLRFICEGTQEKYCPRLEDAIFELKHYQHKLRDELSAVEEQIATSEASLDYLKLCSRRV